MKFRGKKYRAAQAKITQDAYSLAEASALLREVSVTKFDATCEIHVNLNLNTTKADQQLRTSVVLPHGTGKTKKVVAFVPDEMIKAAKDAGALEAGNTDLIEKVAAGWTDFDVSVAHPSVMKDLAKIGKILGTKGLMPNPKAGTVSTEIVQTLSNVMGGQVELKADQKGIVHVGAGKVSFSADKLQENFQTILDAVKSNKPSGAKGNYITSIALTTSMGPSIMLDLSEVK